MCVSVRFSVTFPFSREIKLSKNKKWGMKNGEYLKNKQITFHILPLLLSVSVSFLLDYTGYFSVTLFGKKDLKSVEQS